MHPLNIQKNSPCDLASSPCNLESRSRSPNSELDQCLDGMPPWCEYGESIPLQKKARLFNGCTHRIYRKTAPVTLQVAPVTLKVGQGHPTQNLISALMGCIHGVNMVTLSHCKKELGPERMHPPNIPPNIQKNSLCDLESRSRSPNS